MYDILIKNASVIDGTASPPYEADLAVEGQNKEWASLEDYLHFLAQQRCPLNVIPLVGQGTIQAAVMGFGKGRANVHQMAQMQDLVAGAMQQGAIGLSTGLIYPPGSFTSTEELIELTKVVGDRNGFYFSHIRGEGDTLLEAIGEAIRIGRETGASVQISHFKATRQRNWDKSQQALELISRAQSTGLDITADLYPYRADSTSLMTLLPEWTHVGGPAKTLERLANPDMQVKMMADMQSGGFAYGFEWQDILITSSPQKKGI